MVPLLVLGLVEFVRGALIFSLLPMYGQFSLGISLGVVGSAISLQYLLDNICRLPAGWLTDRVGGKGWMAGGIALSTLGLYLIQTGQNPTSLLIGAGLFGLGAAPLWPSVITGVAAKMPLNKLGEALSKVFVAWLVGAGLGPVVINFVIARSYTLAFWTLEIVLALALLLTLLGQFGQVVHKRQPSKKRYLAELFREVLALKLLYPGMFVQTMSIGVLMPVIAVYARTVFGFSAEQFSYLLVGGGAFTVLLLIPAGRLSDRMGIKVPLIGGFALAAVCLALLPWQQTVAKAGAVGVLLGISYALILPAWNGLQARVVSPEKRGTMWAIFMTIEGVGTATGAFVGGRVWESFGNKAPFVTSALVLAAMAIFYSLGQIDKLLHTK